MTTEQHIHLTIHPDGRLSAQPMRQVREDDWVSLPSVGDPVLRTKDNRRVSLWTDEL